MSRVLTLLIAVGISASQATVALAEGPPVGNAVAGQHKNAMCQGCHGQPGWRTAYPEVYSVPKLGGQHPQYIITALKEYKTGQRAHSTMQAIAAGLSAQDMADLAAYYGGTPAASPTAAK